MRVNEILCRVDDTELVSLHLGSFGIIDYKYGIINDSICRDNHVGDWIVTDICIQKITPNEPVLAITAVKP
mgnify:CR=1 FL=1